MIFSDEIAKSIFHELAQDIFRLPEHKQEDLKLWLLQVGETGYQEWYIANERKILSYTLCSELTKNTQYIERFEYARWRIWCKQALWCEHHITLPFAYNDDRVLMAKNSSITSTGYEKDLKELPFSPFGLL